MIYAKTSTVSTRDAIMPPEPEEKPRKVTFDKVYELFAAEYDASKHEKLDKETFREVLYSKIMERPSLVYRFWTLDEEGLHSYEMNCADFLVECEKHVKSEKLETIKSVSRRICRGNL